MILKLVRSPGVLYGALSLALFWRVFFLGETLVATDHLEASPLWGQRSGVANDYATDTIEFYYPSEVLYSEAVRQGRIPVWNEKIFCGKPIPHGAHLYVSVWPVKLLFLRLFDPDRSYNYYAIFHFWLAAMALYLLTREMGCGAFASLVAGLAYVLGARSMTWLHAHYLMPTLAYAPLVFLFVLRGRRSALWRDFAFASIPLAGLAYTNPHAAIATSAALLLFAPKRGMITIAVALLLSAVVMLPLAELMRASVRDPVGETDYFYRGRFRTWLLLLTLFSPDAFGPATSLRTEQWVGVPPNEYAVYIGLLPITLVVLYLRHARRPEERRFTWIGGVALALGTLWPLSGLLIRALPFLVSLPTRLLYLSTIAACVLFACALDRLRKLPRTWQAAVVALILIDLAPGYLRFNRTYSAEPLRRVPPAIALVKRDPGRVAYELPGIRPPLGLYGIGSIQGYDSTILRSYAEIVKEFGHVEGGRKVAVDDFGSPMLDRLGVRYVIVEVGRPMPPHYRRIYSAEIDLYENLKARPAERVENGIVQGTEVFTPSGGTMEVAEMNYPGWEARIDGKPVPIEGPLLSVRVPPGHHEVTFEFRPKSLRLGAWISMIGVALLVLVGMIDRFRKAIPHG